MATLGVLCLTLVACGGSSDDSSKQEKPAPSSTPLEGTNWVLADANALGVQSTGVVVSARFDRGSLTGESGCNAYRTTYHADSPDLTISATIVTTQRACEPGPTAVETAYLARLPRTASFTLQGNTLTLSDRGGTTLLVYRASGGTQALAREWVATSYYTGNAVRSVIVGTALTADFEVPTVSGSAGCNTFHGPFETNGEQISIGTLVATLEACANEDVATQERQYLAALQLANTYRVTGDRLELFRADGGIAATFEAKSAAR
ncbi:MAG TPA: META domain-containing protein [Acidimicrobiia bacterium]|nr:META domain-containing protein [Acidimicrobiia bacterium]